MDTTTGSFPFSGEIFEIDIKTAQNKLDLAYKTRNLLIKVQNFKKMNPNEVGIEPDEMGRRFDSLLDVFTIYVSDEMAIKTDIHLRKLDIMSFALSNFPEAVRPVDFALHFANSLEVLKLVYVYIKEVPQTERTRSILYRSAHLLLDAFEDYDPDQCSNQEAVREGMKLIDKLLTIKPGFIMQHELAVNALTQRHQTLT